MHCIAAIFFVYLLNHKVIINEVVNKRYQLYEYSLTQIPRIF